MKYKNVAVSDSVSIPVPEGLTREEELNFIANRLAFVDLKELEARCVEALRLSEQGKLIPLREALDEVEAELRAKTNGTKS
jgi:hypothetical protein